MINPLIVAAIATTTFGPSPQRDTRVSLAGQWELELDPRGEGLAPGWKTRPLSDRIELPATISTAKKGKPRARTSEAYHLTEVYPYVGVAWYRRTFTVPKGWNGRHLRLSLERTKATQVWIDGRAVGESNVLSSAQTYDLGRAATGLHTIVVRVDNRLQQWPDRVSASHMLETSTQANWNGVLGKIELHAGGASVLAGMSVAPGESWRQLKVRAVVDGQESGLFTVRAFDGARQVAQATTSSGAVTLDFGSHAKDWNEFSPKLYRLEATFSTATGVSFWSGSTGLREFRVKDASFWVNGRRTFLRGKHDACVFPLTGHPPMEVAGWIRYFEVCRRYGINHVRFHSWCPPEAAFVAADRLGVYLQPELPFWGDPGKPGVEPFLLEEGRRILRDYGHHPSFVMLSLGNEFWGDVAPRPRLVAALRSVDPARLYAQGSNSESWNPREFEGDDFRVSAYIKPGLEGEGRGSYARADKRVGYIYAGTKGTSHTYSAPLLDTKLPFVSHEIGQYQTYPNYGEIAKYTGVLRPDNLSVFRDRLAKAGMLDQAEAFFRASGKLSALLYREEIEAALRTPEMDGFQLLDLQDYPGQGTALVGMLDAFMDSKGLIAPGEWRAFCAPVVLLAIFDRHTLRVGERFQAELRVANYGPSAVTGPVCWQLRQGNKVFAAGEVPAGEIPTGTTTVVGRADARLSGIDAPKKMRFDVEVAGRRQTWPLWVYPDSSMTIPSGVTVGTRLDDGVLNRLARGEGVVLFPKTDDLPGSIPGDYGTDFWNYPMFKGGNPPGTLGYLIQDRHPALAAFPTASHSDWQWQALAHRSRAVVLDGFSDYRPIVQTIDNVERNHRLGTIFEASVAGGRLLVCTIDLPSLRGLPEADQLWRSLMRYAASDRFRPTQTMDVDALRKALRGKGAN